MSIFNNSRYLRTQGYIREGFKSPILKVRDRFTFNPENFTTYTWIEGDTLDGVSYKAYGFTSLRWAILDANPKYRTEFDIRNGDVINLPSYEEVVSIVNVR